MNWDIVKNSGTCTRCEKTLQEEEAFYSSLFLDNTFFLRKDFCENCWNNNPDTSFFSFWKTRIPKKGEPKRRVIDNTAIFTLFLRLGEHGEHHDEPWAKNLRYVLALFLMRKKLLKLKNQGRDDMGEFMELYSTEEDKLFKIHNPNLSEEEVVRLNDEILKLFDPSTAGQSTLLQLTQNSAST
ncbi:MAG: hypothetical protein ACE5IC_09460 [Candidatus Brocadiales bacterium]